MNTYWKKNPLMPVTALAELAEFPALGTHDRVLIVVPHPDDETICTGGLVQRLLAVGGCAHIVMATDGNKHGKKVRRQAEVLAAMAECGLSQENFSFLNFPDGGLRKSEGVEAAVVMEIEKFSPTIVLVTDPEDTHDDHAFLGEVLLRHWGNFALYTMLVHYYRFPRPIGHLPGTGLVPPKRLIDDRSTWYSLSLTEEEQVVKRRAIFAFKSQLHIVLYHLIMSFDRTNELFRVLRRNV